MSDGTPLSFDQTISLFEFVKGSRLSKSVLAGADRKKKPALSSGLF